MRETERGRETENNLSKSSEGVSVRQHRGGIQLLAGKKAQQRQLFLCLLSSQMGAAKKNRVWKKD